MRPTSDSGHDPTPRQPDSMADALEEYASSVRQLLENSTANVSGDTDVDQSVRDGSRCLRMIEAIRVAEPAYLDDLLGVTEPSLHEGHDHPHPNRIGRFQIERQLGRGGFGVVFLAHDPQLHRDVALKVPRPEALVSPEMRRRFVREAEAAAALNHPNIVPVFEAGSVGPVGYIAYAYCDGATLSQWLAGNGGRVDARLAAGMLAVLADAISHAHGRGVLHRDIKPCNILVDLARVEEQQPPSHRGQPRPDHETIVHALRLADFGMARAVETGDCRLPNATISGTPAYMAPEQAEGKRDQISVATDIYGLGATLYHLLTGRPPFQGNSQADVLAAVRDEDPLPIHRLQPDIPRDLEAICLNCLARLPQDRYATAAELRKDLNRFLDGLPVAARPLNRAARLARWSRRNPITALLTAVAGAVVVFCLISIVWQWSRAERHLAEAERQRARAVANKRAAEDAVHQLLTEVSRQLEDTPGTNAMRRSLLWKAAELNEQLLANETADELMRLESIRAWNRAAEILEQLGDRQQLQHAIAESLRLCQLPLDDPAWVPDRDALLARAYERRGEWHLTGNSAKRALDDFQQALAIVSRLPATRSAERQANSAELERNMGLAYTRMGQPADAGEYYQRSVDRMERIASTTADAECVRLQRAASHNSLGIYFRSIHRTSDALEQYRLSADHMESLVEQFPTVVRYRRRLAETRFNMGNLLLTVDHNVQAEVMYQAARADLERLVREFPAVESYVHTLAGCTNGLALSQKRMGRLREAEEAYRQAIALGESTVERFPDREPFRIELIRTRCNLGKLLSQQAKHDEADIWFARSLADAEELLIDHPDSDQTRVIMSKALMDQAGAQYHREDFTAAKVSVVRAIELQQHVLDGNPQNPHRRHTLAETYAKLAELHVRCEALDDGITALRQIVLVDPEGWRSHLTAATAYLEFARLAEQEPSSIEDVESFRETAVHLLSKAQALGAPATALPDFDQLRDLANFPAESVRSEIHEEDESP